MLGALLGKYRVVEQLGAGGMGVVYVGRHEQLGHRVVVKVLRPEMSRNAEMVQRFFNEAQAATAIRNPGIVQVFDFGTTADGSAFIVMELLEGETLSDRLKHRGRLDAVECCRIGRQVANVLQAAHARGITHRDLKPDNLFLVPDAEVVGGERVKVLDFGIAKLAGELRGSGVQTRTDIVMGTPTYMAPEQCRGAGAVDPRADIYSLGCILFKMACGRPPFVGEGAGEIVGAHLHVPPPSPHSLAPDLPGGLVALIMKMLEKQPEARPQTMIAVSQTIDQILGVLSDGPGRPSGSLPMLSPAPAATPPSMPAQSPPSERLGPPSSTTLGAAAGVSHIQVRPRARRFPLVLGGVVLVGAAVALTIVLATRDDKPAQRQISYSDLAAATPAGGGAVAGSAAVQPAPPIPEPAPKTVEAAEGSAAEPEIEMDPAMPAADVAAECQKYQEARKWREVEQCAAKLESHDPARAAELKARAQEGKLAVRAASFEAALKDKNLKKARTELDHLSAHAGYGKLKRKLADAEDEAIRELATRLDRVKDRDCEEYRELLAAEGAKASPRVATEAAQRTPCNPSKK